MFPPESGVLFLLSFDQFALFALEGLKSRLLLEFGNQNLAFAVLAGAALPNGAVELGRFGALLGEGTTAGFAGHGGGGSQIIGPVVRKISAQLLVTFLSVKAVWGVGGNRVH